MQACGWKLPPTCTKNLCGIYKAPSSRHTCSLSYLAQPAKTNISSLPGAGKQRHCLIARSGGEKIVNVKQESSSEASSWKWEESSDAMYAYGILASILVLGATPFASRLGYCELLYFVGLAATTIYIGAHRSLGAKARQQISFKEGALAPIFASCTLFGGYLLIKWFPDLSIQTFINIYFGFLGTFAVSGALKPLLNKLPGADAFKVKLPEWLVVTDDNESLETSWTSFLAVGVGIAVAAADLLSGHHNFTLNNILACLIAADILQLLGIRTSKTAVILLIGLLAYDVFWVFGSPKVIGDNVMMTVATSNLIDGPFKLLFPRAIGGVGEAANYPFSLLGLGDVAVPGLLMCLALRYDASRSVDMKARAIAASDAMKSAISNLDPQASPEEIMDATQSSAFEAYDKVADKQQEVSEDNLQSDKRTANPVGDVILSSRTYFTPALTAYVLGLLIAFLANSVTHLGQPALLYLVPCTLGTIGWKAASRQELARVWNFEDTRSKSPFAQKKSD